MPCVSYTDILWQNSKFSFGQKSAALGSKYMSLSYYLRKNDFAERLVRISNL